MKLISLNDHFHVYTEPINMNFIPTMSSSAILYEYIYVTMKMYNQLNDVLNKKKIH